jgi:formylglycine-generating enzyme required for sulfatase activity
MKPPYRVTYAAVVTLLFQAIVGSIPAEEQEKAPAEPRPAKTMLNAQDRAEMILIPGGRFWMGSTREEVDAQFRETGLPEDWKNHTRDEEPRHEKTLDPFYIYKYEVTNAQYKAFIDVPTSRRSTPINGRRMPRTRRCGLAEADPGPTLRCIFAAPIANPRLTTISTSTPGFVA